MTKKVKRGGSLRVDAGRPSKPSAPAAGTRVRADEVTPPTYDGAAKADTKGAAAGQAAGSSGHTRSDAASKPAQEPVRRPRAGSSDLPPGDQIPPAVRRGRGRPQPAGEQYIRLRIRVRGDQLSVIDSHLVDGPLGQSAGFSGANAYEVSVDDRLLHAGSLPDLGVQRSFPNPNGAADQRGHHFADRSTYEFMARVPAREVTAETIGRIAIRLHRVKEEARTDRLGTAPLTVQFARELRPTAELIGLPASVLPEAIEERGARTPSL